MSDDDPPQRYGCLLCGGDEFGERFLTSSELRDHVQKEHDPSDVIGALLPINVPLVARVPEATTTYEAKVAVKKEGVETETPDVTQAISAGKCPVDGCTYEDDPDTNVPDHYPLRKRHVDAEHDTWALYELFRRIVPPLTSCWWLWSYR